ncbi:MAG: aminopeptidase N [Pseudomonadota bacterium]
MRTQNAPLIQLKDYTPPAYGIDHVSLRFELEPGNTVVTSTLTVRRNGGTGLDAPLVLDGDELMLVSAAIDGKRLVADDYTLTAETLSILTVPTADVFSVTLVTRLDPNANTKLMGLYRSSSVFCTQCEAEGFRRITFFPDRPDVLATYDVRLEADAESAPVLLSNGNPGAKGRLDNGRHFAEWHDPHPKPCYLFALVAGRLDALRDNFTTASGRAVDLAIYVEPGKAQLASFAMDALKRSMVWDEDVYGCEYDLDVFNIVAVSDFNMGAMENKGLNVFNDKYILASPDLATDTDIMHIEAIVAHEYFHNWTGNRITCRDWFQLCLKEGFTVYRDQEFSADTRSRAVQRIGQVRALRAGQFPEDAGPLAHPVRPSAYKEINNFYTATVYQKGAELVRMLATIVGPQHFRAATDRYFARHDGEAAVMEDFVDCFEAVTGRDLSQFMLWYAQAGTPLVTVKDEWDAKERTLTLTISQSTPATPGQETKEPVPIPVRIGLLDGQGQDMPLISESASVSGDVILLTEKTTQVVFSGVGEKPVLSVLRKFSAPVIVHHEEDDTAVLHRARHDSDLFNRWQALNTAATDAIVYRYEKTDNANAQAHLLDALCAVAIDTDVEPTFAAQALSLPSEHDIARKIGKEIDAGLVHLASHSLISALGTKLGTTALERVAALRASEAHLSDLEQAGVRSLRNTLLALLVAGSVEGAAQIAFEQHQSAQTMTDRLAALSMLVRHHTDEDMTQTALAHFMQRHENHALAIDKWFSVQSTIPGARGLAAVKLLLDHPLFTLNNPNRARSVLGPFAMANLSAFHQADGSGYGLFTDQILAMDAINPQVAARLATAFNTWRNFNAQTASHARSALEQIAQADGLSRDVQEIVDRCLTA